MICSDPLVRDWIDPDLLPDLEILILRHCVRLWCHAVLPLLWKTSTVAAWKQSRPINRNIGDRLLLLEQICRNAVQIPYKSEGLSDAQCRRAGWTRDTWGQGCYKQWHCVHDDTTGGRMYHRRSVLRWDGIMIGCGSLLHENGDLPWDALSTNWLEPEKTYIFMIRADNAHRKK